MKILFNNIHYDNSTKVMMKILPFIDVEEFVNIEDVENSNEIVSEYSNEKLCYIIGTLKIDSLFKIAEIDSFIFSKIDKDVLYDELLTRHIEDNAIQYHLKIYDGWNE